MNTVDNNNHGDTRSSGSILVVDDEPLNVAIIERFLHRESYVVHTCTSGREALEILERADIDAVLLDLMMPDIDGFETCKRIHSMPRYRDTPVLVVTSSDSDEDIARAFESGAYDYITKPLRRVELITRLRHALDQRRTLSDLQSLSRQLDKRVKQQTATLQATLDQLRDEIAERQRSQQELAQKHRFITAVLDNTLSGIMSIDLSGSIRSFNHGAEQLFGYTGEEVIGKSVGILMPAMFRTKHDAHVKRFLETGSPRIIGVSRDVIGLRKDGAEIALEIALSTVTNDDQPLFVGIVTDVSDRRKMEAALQTSRARLMSQNEALARLANDAMEQTESDPVRLNKLATVCAEVLTCSGVVMHIRADHEGAWNSYGAATARDENTRSVLGVMPSARQMVRLRVRAIESATSNSDPREPSFRSQDESNNGVLECPIIVKSAVRGLVRCVRDWRQPWQIDERNFVNLIAAEAALLIESDDRQRAQFQVRKHALRLKNAQRIAQMGDWVWNPRNGELVASESLNTMLCGNGSRPISSYGELMESVHPDDRIRLSEATDSSAIYGHTYDIDFRVITPAGQIMFMQGKGEPDPLDTEVPFRVMCTVMDVTARKNAELALKDMRDHLQERVNDQTRDLIVARDQALAGERAMSTFLANMSHEIRTPLHAVLSHARFGIAKAKDAANDELRGYFDLILDSGNDLLQLLTDLLDLSKLRAGRMAYEFGEISLRQIVQEVIDRYAQLIREHGVLTVLKIKGTESLISGDERKIAQVVRNLLSNAIKYNPPRSTIQMTLDFRDRDRVAVTVSDKGPGVPEAELETIFNPFVQGSHTDTNAGGTGLGLAISKEIIEHGHRGRIYAKNNDDSGASFTFELPRSRTE